MKKKSSSGIDSTKTKKLRLQAETLRLLSDPQSDLANGGTDGEPSGPVCQSAPTNCRTVCTCGD